MFDCLQYKKAENDINQIRQDLSNSTCQNDIIINIQSYKHKLINISFHIIIIHTTNHSNSDKILTNQTYYATFMFKHGSLKICQNKKSKVNRSVPNEHKANDISLIWIKLGFNNKLLDEYLEC